MAFYAIMKRLFSLPEATFRHNFCFDASGAPARDELNCFPERMTTTSPFRRIAAFVLFFILFLSQADAKVVISEVMWPGTDLSTSDEWLEITADTDTPLTGWTVTSLNSSGQEAVIARFQTGSAIGNGQYVTVSHFTAAQSRLAADPFLISSSITLPNTKLLLRLRNGNGLVMDEVDDGVGNPFAGSNGTPKASMERIDLQQAGTISGNWVTSVVSQGFDPGSALFGTPGFPYQSGLNSNSSSSLSSTSSVLASSSSSLAFSSSSLSSSSAASSASSASSVQSSSSFSSSSSSESSQSSTSSSSELSSSSSSTAAVDSLIISEVLPNPAGVDSSEWIEIQNIGTNSVAPGHWKLAVGSKKFELTGSSSLLPGQFLLLTHTQTNLTLSNAGGTVSLINPGGITIDSLTYPTSPEAVSFGRLASSSTVQSFCIPTPGGANDQPLWTGDLVLQSGTLRSEKKVTFNLTVAPGNGTLSSGVCHVDFGDGVESNTCNPPSHTFDEARAYTITARIMNYCGTTVERSLTAEVLAQSSYVQSKSSSSAPFAKGDPRVVISHDTSPLTSPVFIAAVLPNPSGDKEQEEWIEVQNSSDQLQNLDGWRLGTSKSKTSLLDSIQLKAGAAHRFSARNLGLKLNNASGAVYLTDAQGHPASTLGWKGAEEGVVIRAATVKRHLARVVHVLDGKTIDVEWLEPPLWPGRNTPRRVQLLGLSSDDTKNTMNYLRDLIENKNIELEIDTEKTNEQGQLEGYAYFDDSNDDVGLQLIKQGLAAADHDRSFSKSALYRSAENQSQVNRLGRWSAGKLLYSMADSFYVLAADIPQSPKNGSGTIKTALPATSVQKKIVISEVLSQPIAKGEDEWIELFLPSSESISLAGWSLDDVREKGSKPWKIPSNVMMEPGAYKLFSSQQTGLKLNNDGDEIWLFDPNGEAVDHVTYGKIKKGSSYARIRSTDRFCVAQPTPGEANICAVVSNQSKITVPKKKASPKPKKSSPSKAKKSIPKIYAKPVMVEEAEAKDSSGSGMGRINVTPDTPLPWIVRNGQQLILLMLGLVLATSGLFLLRRPER